MDDYQKSEENVTPNRTIDAKDLLSPLPLLRLKKELAAMNTGEIAGIICTDRGAGNDIATWCSKMNHTFLGEHKESEYSTFYVKKE